MYAVIESGGKQFRVELGTRIQVDRLDAQPGDSITLERVLLVADGDATAIGQPVVDGASVSAEVLGQDRGEKIVVFKYKPKARTRVKKGFRSELTTLRISDIAFGGKSAAKDAEASESKKAKAEQAAARDAEKAAAEKAAADKELAAKLAAAATSSEAAEAKPKAKTARKSSTKASTTGQAAEQPVPQVEVASESDATPATEAQPAADADPAAQPDADAGDSKKDE
jgi:large subunit ribosomal protein L21